MKNTFLAYVNMVKYRMSFTGKVYDRNSGGKIHEKDLSLVFGYIGQTEYIIKKIKEAGYEDAKVIATGGLGSSLVSETDMIDIYDPDLTLDGLRMIYEKNKKVEC